MAHYTPRGVSINPPDIVTVHHIRFFMLWMLVHDSHLDELGDDVIVWKHKNDGVYSAASAYCDAPDSIVH